MAGRIVADWWSTDRRYALSVIMYAFYIVLTVLFSMSVFLSLFADFSHYETNQQKLSGSCGMLVDSGHDTPPRVGAGVSHIIDHYYYYYYAHTHAGPDKTMNILIA